MKKRCSRCAMVVRVDEKVPQSNTPVSVCPDCHTRFHHGKNEKGTIKMFTTSEDIKRVGAVFDDYKLREK